MKNINDFINKIIQGDALEILKQMPDECVDTIITSPPYWGLRDYGVEGQIGLESTLEEYLEKLLKITAELKRVLKKSGVMFWNHGDCYGGSGCGKGDYRNNNKRNLSVPKLYSKKPNPQLQLLAKCLVLQNWRLILKMIDEQGWILRNTIIWHKPNHMPSSVKDRFTNAYEPVFMLVKNKKYYFDLDAVRVPHTVCGVTDKRPMGILRQKLYPNSGYNKSNDPHLAQYKFNYRVRDAEKKSEQCPQFKATKEEIERYKQTHYPQDQAENFGSPRARYWREKEKINWKQRNFEPRNGFDDLRYGKSLMDYYKDSPIKGNPKGKNPGDLWRIPTQPAPPEVRGKFFAIFPEKLVEPMILAGCPKNRIVLDPFLGSGTTAVVAKKLGRNFIGIELNPEYAKIAEARIKAIQKPLL